jgi:Mrp family chromosome partitioning ATPase
MGRILEALRRADAQRKHADPVIVPRAYQPVSEAEPDSDSLEEIPFIEVGGPRTAVQTPRTSSPPAQETKAGGSGPHQPSVLTIGTEPLPVVFHPLLSVSGQREATPDRFAPELVAFHQPDHPVSEQYRGLLAGLGAQLPDSRPRVVLFTSARPGVGTTNVLLNVAITCALQGQGQVAIVDANLRRPAVAQRLGLSAVPGLQDVLASHASLARALQETGLENLEVLSVGEQEADGPIRLAGEAMRSLLRQLGQRFHWIFVDGPCWDGRPELVALGTACDAVCLVLPQAEAQSADVASLLKIIPEQGAPLRGCVLVQH